MQGRMPLLSPARSITKARGCCCGGQDLLVRGAVQTPIFSHILDLASPAMKSWCRFWANSLCREPEAEPASLRSLSKATILLQILWSTEIPVLTTSYVPLWTRPGFLSQTSYQETQAKLLGHHGSQVEGHCFTAPWRQQLRSPEQLQKPRDLNWRCFQAVQDQESVYGEEETKGTSSSLQMTPKLGVFGGGVLVPASSRVVPA